MSDKGIDFNLANSHITAAVNSLSELAIILSDNACFESSIAEIKDTIGDLVICGKIVDKYLEGKNE